MKRIITLSFATILLATQQLYAGNDKLAKIYNGEGFSIHYPPNYKIDDTGLIEGTYLSSERIINGVVISKTDKGSNLSWASISLERNALPANEKCSALSTEPILGLEAISKDQHQESIKDGDRSYSTISLGDAAMQKSISEDIWAIEDTNPCIVIRYIISSTRAEAFDPPLKEFDEKSLRQTFDEIRRSVKLN
jgi:hypothetical protein